ncbi:hypothetical protein [Methylobacterium radiotolerans]|uniref:hypothetical protein n=1 Tax=Methylobacterium radiotolerans TaxID=31998 RepID=UPI001F1DE460|nr:hypothetical protein [Methylobacterium radiotolerans]UIY43519.1 hypothetical protein LZ599_07415 [Methylobacterium radiotolerans]
MPEGSERQVADAKTCLLAQIADHLGVPLTEFFEPHLLRGAADRGSEDAFAVHALVKAYLAIDDGEARDRVIALARSYAPTEPRVNHAPNPSSRPSAPHA